VLFLGFFVLLLLVVDVGYRSSKTLEDLEKRRIQVDETEELHFRVVLDLSETVGKITPEVTTVAANRSSGFLSTVARHRLDDLKREMDTELDRGEKTSLVESQEWKQFEAASKDFWATVHKADLGSNEWHDQRERLTQAVQSLDELVKTEHASNDVKAHDMSVGARRRVATETGAVLIVGFVVAALAFYEIRRNMKRLGQAYTASAHSRDYLQSLLDSLVSGVVVIGQDGTVQTISDSFRRVASVGLEPRIGQSYTELFEDNPSLLAAVSEEISETPPNNRYYGRVDLGARLFDFFTSPLVVAGERQGVILIFVDVTDTARAQAELGRNRALTAIGQMTAQIAHEIKNPLGSIRFAAELLKRQLEANQPKDRSTIEVIERSVDHLAAIVAELSEFARPKTLNLAELNLNNLLDELLPMVADRLNAKQMRIEKQYDRHIPAGQYDGTELRKLFLNLIINAIEASEPSSSIELRTTGDSDHELAVEVVDHGSGMNVETRRRLFEPFYTTKEKGTGLGMAIAKKIAELHNGDLVVESQPGKGTAVTVRLPLIKFAEADNRMEAANRLSG